MWNLHKIHIDRYTRVNYAEAGEGPEVMLLLHGLGNDLHLWKGLVQYGSEHGFRVIALDLPGHGLTKPADDFDYSMASFSEVIDAFLAVLNIRHCVVVGHSMGGLISAYYAASFPKSVMGVMLASPAGIEEYTAKEKSLILNYLQFNTLDPASYYSFFYMNAKNNFKNMFANRPFLLQSFVDADDLLTSHDMDYVYKQCILTMLNEPAEEALKKIKCPGLVLFGQDDPLIPNRLFHSSTKITALAEAGKNHLKDGEATVYEHCGHYPMVEMPSRFNEETIAFAKKCYSVF